MWSIFLLGFNKWNNGLVYNFSMSNSTSAQSRYSFYADPRYHDYHRSTQGGQYNHLNQNGSNQSSVQRSPYLNRLDTYNSLPKRDKPQYPNDYSLPSTNSSKHSTTGHHQRYKSYDSNSKSAAHDPLHDYDDPTRVNNSLYAQIRKPPIGGISNPARV